FSYYPILSQTTDGEGDKGYLTMEYIQSKIQISEDQNFYICGPAVMTEKMMDQFEQLNIPEDNIFMEQFVSPATIDESQIPERSVTVTWQGESFSYKGRENLLAFLESQNQFIPYACRAGVCGSCKCRITGKYKSFSNSGLTKTEQKQGLALACVCYPEEDVKVELT
ncbi:MAG: 2Fe-2S iron-sulfur cluster binding domain-containing protein, partial [Bdellovibrionales bacterium]|nr:2Fe-2S iron-sulfur cluster binding domain-containing protein [Bdellovibrionales bacterium]